MLQELKAYIHDSAAEQRAKVEELKASVEDTELEKREDLFNQIDKIEKEILEIYEKALDEVLPTAFSIVKETGRSVKLIGNSARNDYQRQAYIAFGGVAIRSRIATLFFLCSKLHRCALGRLLSLYRLHVIVHRKLYSDGS